MGKLIDTDDVKTWLQERIDGYESLHLGGNSRSAELKIIIDELPVRVPDAYDPDKVVEQLDKASDYYEFDEQGMEHVQMLRLVDAIEIVKGGGVDAKTDS